MGTECAAGCVVGNDEEDALVGWGSENRVEVDEGIVGWSNVIGGDGYGGSKGSGSWR